MLVYAVFDALGGVQPGGQSPEQKGERCSSTFVELPKKPALATLAQTVGREVLVENRGRKAKISKKKRRVSYRRKNRDGFDVMDSGLF